MRSFQQKVTIFHMTELSKISSAMIQWGQEGEDANYSALAKVELKKMFSGKIVRICV